MALLAPSRAARILIVDDSAVMRSLLRTVVISDKRLEVAGTAIDGASALRAMDTLRPDLVLLDVEMPGMNGLQTLNEMRAKGIRVPVIMCSSLTQRGAKVTIDALASGAADYVAKPAGQESREVATRTLVSDVVPKILALTAHATASHSGHAPPAARSVFPFVSASTTTGPTLSQPILTPTKPSGAHPANSAAHAMFSGSQPPLAQSNFPIPPAVVCIGVSTGGPAALDILLPAIPAGFPLPILIVQHMPELFTRLLAERLDTRCPLHVAEAAGGESVQPGNIYIAKGNWHMEVVAKERGSGGSIPAAIRLNQDEPENFCRPAADVLFRTAVGVYGGKVLGVVLTGMGYDGLIGSRLIREHNGTVIAQDQATSTVWGMPGAVSQAGLAQRILPLQGIASEILRLVGRGQREAVELRESVV